MGRFQDVRGFAGLLGVATCANVRNWLVGVKMGLIFQPGLWGVFSVGWVVLAFCLFVCLFSVRGCELLWTF